VRFVLKQQRRLFLVYNINDLSDHDDEIASILALVGLCWFPIQAVSKLPNGGEVAVLGLLGQLLRYPAKSKWITAQSDPQCVIERLFSIHTSDRSPH